MASQGTRPSTSAPARNFPALLAQGGAYSLAGQLASTSIVLPFLCTALGGSLVVAGLLVPINTLGTLAGDALAPVVLALRWSSRTWMAVSVALSATLLLALASTSVLFADRGTGVSAFFAVVALGLGIVGGIGSVSFSDVLGSALPAERRTTLLFAQSAIGGGLAVAVALLAARLFAASDPLVGHVALQFIAAGFLVVSAVCAALVVTAPTRRPAQRQTIMSALRAGSTAVRTQPWFRGYLVRQVLFLSVSLATSFFSIRVATLHADEAGSLGLVVGVTSAALVVGAVVWERVLVRDGYRRMLVLGTVTSAVAAVGALAAEALGDDDLPFGHAAVMLLATLAAQAVSVGKSGYLVAHATAQERPLLSSFSSLTIGFASGLLAALLAAVAQIHGTAWPVGILVVLNVVAVAAALRMPAAAGQAARAA